ncbi:MAG TPA: 16S rRNA (cytidine(1402)-2'-O)-methyltransferase [Gemmatimonadaceae bacterium]|nr:16S rRNA (cytidine(1402)-2'-O)-methyltransferase [Gemmatimonadaceae bacterium]
MNAPGTLYIVSTPIGNLGDITYRAVDVLKGVALICAEDTRHVRKLLDRYQVKTRALSYEKNNEARRTPQIMERLTSGEDIALVTDAGTPLISDPGQRLVAAAIAAGISVVPIPGASAPLAALVASGLDSDTFTFVGFLPRSGRERDRVLSRLSALRHTSVMFESPSRLAATLLDLLQKGLGGRQTVVARELTKQHEEFRRGTVSELEAYYRDNAPRGEVVIVVEGRGPEVEEQDEGAMRDRARVLKAQGSSTRDTVASLVREYGVARNQAYRIVQEAQE